MVVAVVVVVVVVETVWRAAKADAACHDVTSRVGSSRFLESQSISKLLAQEIQQDKYE